MTQVHDEGEIEKRLAPEGGGEDDYEKDLKFYMRAENAYVICEKRWGLFSLFGFIVYCYHFTMCIYGVDVFCHYSRFKSDCKDKQEDYMNNSAIFDGII